MKKSPDGREERNQQAFDEMADEMGFELERSSFSEGEHYGVGFIPMLGRRLAVTVPRVEKPPEIDTADEDHVVALVAAWESIQPDDLPKVYSDYVTDPVLLVDPSGVVVIDARDMELTAKDKLVDQTMEKYPICNPRKVKLSDVNVVFVGLTRAGLTATLEEELQNGDVQRTKINHILIKTLAGWRITILTKELVH